MSSPYLGLDIGVHKTGVAVSESGIVAAPLGVIENKPPHRHELLRGVAGYVAEYGVRTIVIGLPFTGEDEATARSNAVEAVTAELRAHLAAAGLTPEIVTVNEFGSTRAAKAAHPDLDDNAAAAAIILQEYLDGQ